MSEVTSVNGKTGVVVLKAADVEAVPTSSVGAANGVASLNSGGKLPETQLPSTVVSGSLINAAHFATGGVLAMTNLVKTMEEERKGFYIPENLTMGEQVLLNETHVASPSTFQYGLSGLAILRLVLQLPSMVTGQVAFRINETAEGVPVNEALYTHPDVTFENLAFVGSGSADGGSVASAYNRTFRIVNVSLKSLANGFINKGYSDVTYIEGLAGDHTVTGWLWQGENGDGQEIHNLQAYGGKGILAKHGSGLATGVVSGEHKFVVSKWSLMNWHLEGDGPNETGGKAQNPLIVLEGGVYDVNESRLYTLTNPNRPAVEVNDGGVEGRATLLTLRRVQFMQRLDNPANPAKLVEPVGNLQGIAIHFGELASGSIVKLIDTHAECFQQTSEASGFDTRQIIGMRFTAANAELQTQLNNRRVMINSGDTEIFYNAATSSYEIQPIGREHDQVITHRFATPVVNLAKLASGSTEAKAAPTTLKAGTYHYNVWAIDDRGRKTNLSAEKSVTIAEGETSTAQILAGYPCRVILQRGISVGVFGEWVELILPRGQTTLADMGSAIGGQEWTAVGSASAQTGFTRGSEPTTATAENNTADGYVVLGTSSYAVSFVSAIFTTGEWQREGDVAYVNGVPARCVQSASTNNGGTWILLPANTSTLSEGEGNIAREQCTTTPITMTSKVLRLGFFTATKTQTIKHMRAGTGSTGAGATPTRVQFAAYSVNPSTGALTLVANTPNNTALLKEPGEEYEEALETAWQKVAGERYALGLLVVTTATAPTIAGISSSLPSAELAKEPRVAAAQTATETLPSTIAKASLANTSAIPYLVTAP